MRMGATTDLDRNLVRLRHLPLTATLVAAIVLSACSSSSKDDAAAPVTSAVSGQPSTTAAPTPSTAVGPASDKELAALLVTEVPSGFALQLDSVGDTGPSDLAKAIRDDPTPGAARALRDEGFVRGYQRLWLGPNDAQIIVFLYQFGTEAGAVADYERSNALLPDLMPTGATTFTVDGLPEGHSTGVVGSADGSSAALVQFTTGVYNVQVVSNAALVGGLQARVSDIAQDQFDRLS